ncbi:uncharacterized protein EV154DRAFT_554251 [Mucor mucedo]|uniref:uncharacterized protein n=1 Tax=Mucor mucedo TaxID=29922 RepID=UPI00221ED2A3|nr:uncharacterized protein EV154DRAFT_554251 [Mucor mucedo]KAI7887883.1 hypothetical protein EV154DRAFT_554251 [Mucor mucedo]
MALVVVCIASFGFQYNNLTGACRLLFQELLTKTSATPVAWWRVNIERVTRRWDGRSRLKPVDTFLVIGIGVGCYIWSGSDDSRKFSARMHLAAIDWHPVGQLPHLHGMLTLKPILVQVRLLRFYCQGLSGSVLKMVYRNLLFGPGCASTFSWSGLLTSYFMLGTRRSTYYLQYKIKCGELKEILVQRM